MSSQVNAYGWTIYSQLNPRHSYSLNQPRTTWTSRESLQYDSFADNAFKLTNVIARSFSGRRWSRKMRPLLAISSSRLVMAVGSEIFIYMFGVSDSLKPTIKLEGKCDLAPDSFTRREITSITFIQDGGLNGTLHLGFLDGTVERIRIVEDQTSLSYTSIFREALNNGERQEDAVHFLTSHDNLLLSLTGSGRATLANSTDGRGVQSTLEIGRRSWASFLSIKGSHPYVAVGTSAPSPFSVYSITESGLASSPSLSLSPGEASNAAYSINSAPIASPWGSSPQVIVTGWYDGFIRCYDLRVPNSSTKSVLEVSDPCVPEPIYSLSCGGGSGCHIAAGLARHSLVSFWDVRCPKRGWSVYAPGNDRSPVYSLILESSRLYGTTQDRAFLFEFGPNPSEDLYPPQGPGSKATKAVGFPVTKYLHANPFARI